MLYPDAMTPKVSCLMISNVKTGVLLIIVILALLQLGTQFLEFVPVNFATFASKTTTGVNTTNASAIWNMKPPAEPANSDWDHCHTQEMIDNQFCMPWPVEMDSWWTHHPEWEVSFENDICFCFRKMASNSSRFKFLREIYYLQFSESTNCSNVYSKKMFNSGWGVDTEMLADRQLYGYQNKRPFQLITKGETWKYAISTGREKAFCNSPTMFCYFLPLGRCTAGEHYHNPKGAMARDSERRTPTQLQHMSWLRIHTARPQQWFRKRLYEYMKVNSPPNMQTPCVAIHVRRNDVVKDGIQSRKYFAISEYLERIPSLMRNKSANILLFTDDANAIDEAHEFHPDYNWMYVNRTRYRGAQAGFGKHLPTNNPVTEVLAIHSIFRLAKQCHTFVHSQSSFSLAIYDYMKAATGSNITRIQIDISDPKRRSPKHNESEKVLAIKLEQLRRKKFGNGSIT